MGLYSLNVYFIPPVFPFAKKTMGKIQEKHSSNLNMENVLAKSMK